MASKKLMHGSLSFFSDKGKNVEIGIVNNGNSNDVSFVGEESPESNSFSQSREKENDGALIIPNIKAFDNSFIDREEGVKECQREEIII